MFPNGCTDCYLCSVVKYSLVFFPKFRDNPTRFQRKCFRTVAQTAIYVSKEEKNVSKTWAGNFVFEKKTVFFSRFFDFVSKLRQFFFNELKTGSINLAFKCHKNFLGGNFYMKKLVFLLSEYLELEDKELGVSENHFRSCFEIAFGESTGTVCETVSFKKLLWN